MKDKGYTLTEVLAVIVILGIILLVAVPSISKLKSEIEKRKVKKDAEMFMTLAREYVESNTDIGTSEVTLSQIDKNKLNGNDYLDTSKVTVSNCSFNMGFRCSYKVLLENNQYKAVGPEDSINVGRK